MADDIPTERFSSKKYRVVERDVKKKTQRVLGDFDDFDLAEKAMEKAFRENGVGWYGYSFYNASGVEMGTATGTKRKVLWFMKTNLSSSFTFTS